MYVCVSVWCSGCVLGSGRDRLAAAREFAFLHLHVCVCMYICVCMYMCVCVCIYVCVCVCMSWSSGYVLG